MRARRLTMTAILMLMSALAPCPSDGQNAQVAAQIPSPREIDQFFQGKLQADSLPARFDARYLQLMGERPLVEMVGPQAPQIYRFLLETRPYGVPVVVRLSIGPDGTGEVNGKIGHSPRFPDHLTEDRMAKLSQADTDKFLRLLAGSDFWSMPVFETIDPHHVLLGEPGWTFEGAKEGSYHVVFRGTSGLASLRNAVMFLQHVSKLDLASTANRPDYASISNEKSTAHP